LLAKQSAGGIYKNIRAGKKRGNQAFLFKDNARLKEMLEGGKLISGVRFI
jgi:hypothetical protein